uniref:Rap1 GTPase-GDP dissociation stimulator 1 n=1 Tax=Scleropages formosus TaxID=113540 RepID=A0A8C9UXK2_SCLFO
MWKLKLASADSAADSMEGCLDCLLKALTHNNAEASEKIRDAGVLDLFSALLAPKSPCAPKVANIVAEVAKNEFMRSPCVGAGLLPPLVQLLRSEDQDVLLQTGRALGNICYDSREYRTPSCIDCRGCFSVCVFVSQPPLTCLVLVAHADTIKLQLVEAGLVESLLEVVDRTVDGEREEDMAELKTASDLMVLLLLGDESMQKLFEGGQGSVFQRVLSWVPSHNHQLQLAGALAIANFARNDGNCIHMVETGIVQKLLDLLERHVNEGNVTVQHAALSALRNLAIPVVNKSKMLSLGVADVVLKFLPSEMPPVQFKLLGTLRMLIDTQAQAAEQLGTNPTLVERLTEWCEAKDHAGVMGESSRLLSALIRHSRSKDVVRTVIQGGGVKHLVNMATSEHVIMQNEALVALGLMAALDLGLAEKDFEGTRLVQVLHKLLSDERSAPEIKYNSMILICAIMGSEPLHQAVRGLAFLDVVAKLRAHENQTVAQQASLTEQRLTVQS